MFKNPWEELEETTDGWVHPGDIKAIREFNCRYGNAKYGISLTGIPAPFYGPIKTCKLLLLLTNPSVGEAASKEAMTSHLRAIKNLHLPHPHLENKIDWWEERTRALRSACDIELAQKIAVIQYFPYASHRFHSYWETHSLPTQKDFTFPLLQDALSNDDVIVLTRSEKKYNLWRSTSERLGMATLGQLLEKKKKNKTLHWFNSYQSAYITKNNLPPNVFNDIVSAFKS